MITKNIREIGKLLFYVLAIVSLTFFIGTPLSHHDYNRATDCNNNFRWYRRAIRFLRSNDANPLIR